MPREYKNFGVEFLFDNEDITRATISYFAETAKKKMNGYKYMYLHYKNNSMETFLTNLLNEKEKLFDFDNMNIHCANNIVWRLKVISVLERNYGDYVLALCSYEDGDGLCPICFINPDVLPRIAKGDIITAQIVALPVSFEVYESEEAFLSTLPEWEGFEGMPPEKGRKLGVSNGAILPIKFLLNHQPNKDEPNKTPKNNTDDNIVLIKGIVEELQESPITFGEAELIYYGVTINTQWGDLELYIGQEQLGDTAIEVGDTIVASCIISADVAIYEYDQGAIFSKENFYLLLLDALESGDYSRLKNCLAKDCHYRSKHSGKDIIGKDEIISFLESVYEAIQNAESKDDYRFFASHITAIRPSAPEDKPDLQWKVNDSCILESIDNQLILGFFITIKDKKISEIFVETDHRYEFFIPNNQ
ncbi:MAG: nuclear transport factor 2 family protein [Clostridia bacterium]